MNNKPIKFSKSEELFKQALKLIPGGTTQAKQPENYLPGEYPIFIKKGKGAYIWDVDGNKFIDYVMSYGTVALGYCEDIIDNEVIKEIRDGFAFPLSKPTQNKLAELLIEIIPCAERVYLFRTGSDSTTAAVRVARIFTGRDKIIRWGYNGWHDWCCIRGAGIPNKVREDTLTFKYNDLNSLEEVFNNNKNKIAAVIMMPLEIEKPKEGFLQGVKELAHKNGALFILDEMRSGFRVSLGGAQEYYKVIPDMATFSKAIANGYAISVLTGKEDIMNSIFKTHFSSTFFTNSLAMVAAVANIERIKKGDVIPHLWDLGSKLMKGLKGLVDSKGIEAEVVGLEPMPYLIFKYDSSNWFKSTGQDANPAFEKGSLNEIAWKTFYKETIQNGIFFHPNHHWFISRSHTLQDIDYTLSVCEKAFDAVKKVV